MKVVRRTLSWVFLQGTILLGFSALTPFSDTSVALRVLMLIAAVILAAGLLPISYLHRFTAAALDQRPARGSSLLVLVSFIGPLFMLIISILAISTNLDNIELIDQLGTPFIDPQSAKYIIIQFAILGLISLVALAWNSLDLIRSRGTAQAA